MRYLITIMFAFSWNIWTFSQNIDLLQLESELQGVNATFEKTIYQGQSALKVVPENIMTEAKFIKLNIPEHFNNGIIEIDVAGKRLANAGRFARGFVGVAFRIKEDNSRFECFYIRPTNGRADDQVRRNHSVQYISYPDFPWQKLREETPGKYETYADLVEGEWTKLKIEVSADKAKIFINGVAQPTMIVNDLKLGADQAGKLGLWVGPGTEAYFTNLKVTNR